MVFQIKGLLDFAMTKILSSSLFYNDTVNRVTFVVNIPGNRQDG